jgi:hypothetical protein
MHLQSMDNLINYFTCIIYTVSVFVSTPGACTIKLFSAIVYGFSQEARAFDSGKPFQPSLMFAGKTGAYPFRCSTLG